jgi:NADPH:quinone reductase-like Zn-dependent oxidoreductase/SAM-dependent methyltransferase
LDTLLAKSLRRECINLETLSIRVFVNVFRYCAGALSIESACKVAYYRGLLADELIDAIATPGAMMSINLSCNEVPAYMEQSFPSSPEPPLLHIACINSPTNVTVSGTEADIDRLKEKLDSDGIFARKLTTGVAYHSPAMKAMSCDYIDRMGDLYSGVSRKPSITMVSTVTGSPIVPKQLSDPHYWVKNLLSPVRFVEAIDCILQLSNKAQLGLPMSRPVFDLIEIGPYSALRRPCKDIVGRSQRATEIRYAAVLDRNHSSIRAVLNLIGTLASIGYPVSVTDANNRGHSYEKGGFLVHVPQYPFDRSQRYWHETRLSYDYRMRGSVPRDVLGARSSDWNPLEPKWRKIIRIHELPWVADHVVTSNCIYPATGSLIMAIEAIHQTVPENRTIKSFFVKEATFSSPIIIRQDSDGQGDVECAISLRPIRKSYEKESKWFEVWISTYHEGTWTECFRTTIEVQYNDTQGQVDAGKEHELAHQAAVDTYGGVAEHCRSSISSSTFYKYCAEKGVTYGPSFRILEDIAWGSGGVAIGRVDVTRPAAQYQGLVHPAILDAACQVCWLAPSKGLSERMPTEVPHRLSNTYIAASGWRHPSISHVKISAKARFTEAGKGVEGSIIVLGDNGSLLCSVQRLELSPVSDESPHDSLDRNLMHGIRYMPYLSMATPSQLASICNVDQFVGDETALANFSEQLTQTLCMKMQEVLAQVSELDRQTAAPHFQKYLSWMGRICAMYSETDSVPEHPLNDKLNGLDASKPEWAVYTAVARNLISIIRGETDPLDLVFSTNLAERYYTDIFRSVCDERFSTLMDLVSHENPGLAILEVGAGTGSMTSQVISALVDLETQHGGTRFAKYIYTDLSHAFFEDARSRFQKTRNRMEFKALDLQRDIDEQGFELGAFDVVVAGSVIHTTPDLSATLRNVRKALKPGGKLILFENTAPNIALQFGFGTLPGWWLGTESWRVGDQDQCTTEDQWHNLLVNTGFSGNDLVIRDTSSTKWHTFSVMVSTAQEKEVKEPSAKPRILMCIDDTSDLQLRLADAIRNGSLNSVGNTFEVFGLVHISSLEIGPDDRVIALFEVEKSLLRSLTASKFAILQQFIQKCQNLMWLTCADVNKKDFSFAGMTVGFLRTMRSEATNRRIIALALEGSCFNMDECAAYVADVFENAFADGSREVEYIVRNGQIFVPRLFEEKSLNKIMLESVYPRIANEPWGEGPPVMFDVGTRGTLDSLRWIEDPECSKHLEADEVEVEARAWGLNFRDVFIALGRMEEYQFGLDTAGYVTRVGSNCSSLSLGDRVLMIKCGSMRKLPRSHQLETIKIPDSISFEDATSIIAPAMTAHHCLIDIARLQEGEKILIHSAAGATGQLAIQIAQMIGAEIFATVGNTEKKHLVTSLGIADDHVFDSRDTTFANGIQRLTNGYGVDVVLNSLSGDGLRASWECIAPFGRFIEIGKADIKVNSALPMQSFAKNTSFFAVDVSHVIAVRKQTTRRLLRNTMDLFLKGNIRQPQPRHVYSVSDIESAFRFLQSGKNTGRIVINNTRSNIVPVSFFSLDLATTDE